MKKILILTLGVLIVMGIYLYTRTKNEQSITQEQAVSLVKKSNPTYNDYPSDNLPPKQVEVVATEDGFFVGMYILGSGLPGILRANCFHVSQTGEVIETGMFGGEGPAKAINLATCVPQE